MPIEKTSRLSFLDPYAVLRRDHQDDLINEVLDRMYDTDVINDAVSRDLGLDNDVTKYGDPRTKMALRHQQVAFMFKKKIVKGQNKNYHRYFID